MKKIILASASPRRREILKMTGLKFKVDSGGREEEMRRGMSPRALARLLSREKAEAVAVRHKDALIIAADTFIVYRGMLFGKPHTEKEALRMLSALNGKAHAVITGFTIIDTDSGKMMSRSVKTRVWFKKLAANEIKSYVKSGEPLDKAGGYAVQGRGAALVRKIEGDFFNVVGLPLGALVRGLKEFGVCALSSCGMI